VFPFIEKYFGMKPNKKFKDLDCRIFFHSWKWSVDNHLQNHPSPYSHNLREYVKNKLKFPEDVKCALHCSFKNDSIQKVEELLQHWELGKTSEIPIYSRSIVYRELYDLSKNYKSLLYFNAY